MTINGALHLQADVGRLNVTRGEEEGGYQWRMWEEWRNTVCRRAEVNSGRVLDVFAKQKMITEQQRMKLEEWRDKSLHEQYLSKTDEKEVCC